MATKGTGVAVGGMGELVGSGVLAVVSVISFPEAVAVGTVLDELQAESKMGSRQMLMIIPRGWRRLIGQIIPANRSPTDK